MKHTIFMFVLILITSCERNDYDQLTDNQKKYLLYKPEETFRFIRNEKDTIDFKVSNIDYTENYTELFLNRISLTTSSIRGRIRIKSNDDYSISFDGKYFAYNDTIYTNTEEYSTNLNDLILIGDTTINFTDYKNVYFIYDKYDSLFFSLERGIIQIKYGQKKDKYDLIE